GTATEATAASAAPEPRNNSSSPAAAATAPTTSPASGAQSIPARAAGRSQRVTRTGSTVRVPKANRRPSAGEAERGAGTGADYPVVSRAAPAGMDKVRIW